MAIPIVILHSPHHIIRKHALMLINIETLVKLFLDRSSPSRNPDFQFRIHIERTCCLNAEMRDALIGIVVDFNFFPCKTLLVYEDKLVTSCRGNSRDNESKDSSAPSILTVSRT